MMADYIFVSDGDLLSKALFEKRCPHEKLLLNRGSQSLCLRTAIQITALIP
jgi:hypothetical protein